MPGLRLALLGRFELIGPDGPIDLTSKKLVGLLTFLACTSPEPQSREKLMALLWGSRFDAQAHQSLRQALTRLRRVLGPLTLISNAETVALDAEAIDCDVVRFEMLVRDGSRNALAEAVDLYRDRLLPGIAILEEPWAEWLDLERQKLESLALDAMVKLGECELQRGEPAAALHAGERALSVNDLREDAHRLVMRALAAEGRRVEALTHYEHLSALLKHELDVAPDPLTRRVVEEIRSESTTPPGTGGAASEITATDAAESYPFVSGREDLGSKQGGAAGPPNVDSTAAGRGRESAPASLRTAPLGGRFPRRARLPLAPAAALALLAIAIGTMGWLQLWGDRFEAASPERMAFPLPREPSIAVLPFAEPDSDAAQELIGDGLTESLVNVLARNPLLFVVAHSSTSRYAGRPDAVKNAAEELGVRYVVEGSVKRAGDRVRVTVQLIDAVAGSVLWSERYDRLAGDLLNLEEEITAQIARSLDVRIVYGTDQSSGGTRRLDAWTAYLQGRSEYLKFSTGGNDRAKEHFERAVEIDPNYAEAILALAHTHLMDIIDTPKEEWDAALARIGELEAKAARIAPRMPRLHHLRSLVALTRGDYELALAEAEDMAELDPNGAESHAALGRIYLFTAQYERAIESFATAERIDPYSRGSYALHSAIAQLALGRADSAVSTLEKGVERWPDYSPAHSFLAVAYQLAGRDADARRQLARLPAGDSDSRMLALERFLTAMKDRDFAARVLAAARQVEVPQ